MITSSVIYVSQTQGVQVSTQQIVLITFGLIASLMLLFAFLPQTILTIRSRNTVALSLLMYLFGTSARFLFSLAAILTIVSYVWSNDIGINLYASTLPILICHGINLVLNSIVLIIKIINVKKSKKLNISESDLINQYLVNKMTK